MSAKDTPAPQAAEPGRAQPVEVPGGGHWWRRLLAFAGPGYLVAVGYMDPGNWATDVAGGAQLGYLLLSVILLSSLMAMLLQALSARLGIASGLDLAQACRERYSPSTCRLLWLACETAIIACDLAEVIGTAIALKLLFGLPLAWGALLCVGDALLVLVLIGRGQRPLEAFVVALLTLIFACFAVQLLLSRPELGEVLQGFLPSPRVLSDPAALYLAIGIVGATVMPHNLYLHSSLVQSRAYPRSLAGKRQALRWAVADSSLALTLALLVNAAILIVAASVFHRNGHTEVVDIEQAHALLSPLLGLELASLLFAVALLASGLNSTVTTTLAGQIVMEGFLRLRLAPWARRLLTRGVAVLPVLLVTLLYGEDGTARLLIFSQVILSMQLPLAVIPLLQFVSDRRLMGPLAIGAGTRWLAWAVALAIVGLNLQLLADFAFGQHQGETFGGVYHPRDDLFRGADETAVADADEGPGAGQFLEQPLHLGRIAVAIRPFDEDAAVRLQVFHFDFLGNPVHVPVPAQPFPGFEAGIAAAEPEPGGDGRIDEGFEDLGDGAADQHFRLGDDLCDGSHGKSSMGVGKGTAAASGGRSRLMAQAGYFSFRA